MSRLRMTGGPKVVAADVLAGINAVRATGLTNMLDHRAVSMLAGACGYLTTGAWVEANPTTYTEGVIRGFTAASTFDWNAPLIDEDNNLHHDGCVGDNDGDDDD